MCRGQNFCTELGTVPSKWDKESPLRPLDWFHDEIEIFILAVNKFIEGNREDCIQLLDSIKNTEITQWYIEHGQMSGKHRNAILQRPYPSKIPIEQRDSIRSPSKYQLEVFSRDGYRCRYCGIKLVDQNFLRKFIKALDYSNFHRGRTNLDTHGIIHLTWPVADHVKPWNIGGETSLENLVSSCPSCNYGKDGYTCDQLGIQNPLERNVIKNSWNGLKELVEEFK